VSTLGTSATRHDRQRIQKIAYGEWFYYVDPATRSALTHVMFSDAMQPSRGAKLRTGSSIFCWYTAPAGRASKVSRTNSQTVNSCSSRRFGSSNAMRSTRSRKFGSGTIIFRHAIAVIRRPALFVASLVIAFRWIPCRALSACTELRRHVLLYWRQSVCDVESIETLRRPADFAGWRVLCGPGAIP